MNNKHNLYMSVIKSLSFGNSLNLPDSLTYNELPKIGRDAPHAKVHQEEFDEEEKSQL